MIIHLLQIVITTFYLVSEILVMESFGKILKTVREEKDIEIDLIATETSISKEYLIALEEENLEVIPGSTYTAGFLRNYSDYLGCNTKYLLDLYHAKILQESPTPAELLQIGKGPTKIIILSLIGVLIFSALIVGGIFLYKHLDAKTREGITTVNLERIENRTYTLSYNPITIRVYDGDILRIPFTKGDVDISIESTNENLHLSTPVGLQVVQLGEDFSLDVDENGSPDISLFLSDVSKGDSFRGAEVTMFLKPEAAASITVPEEESNIPTDSSIPASGQLVLFEGNRAYPFTMIGEFRGECVFRYQSDRKEMVENYLKKDETINCTSSNSLRIWMSNANAVQLKVQGDGKTIDIPIGKAGQVLVQDIRWIRDNQGIYKLVVLEVE